MINTQAPSTQRYNKTPYAVHTYWIEFIIPWRCCRCCQQLLLGNSTSPPEMLCSAYEGDTLLKKRKKYLWTISLDVY